MSEYVYIQNSNGLYLKEENKRGTTIIPYVHLDDKHYIGNKLVRGNENLGDRIKQIQLRYYERMREQLKPIIELKQERAEDIIGLTYIDNLDESNIEKLIDAIEGETADQFNKVSELNQPFIDDFNKAVKDLRDAMKKNNSVDDAFFNLVEIVVKQFTDSDIQTIKNILLSKKHNKTKKNEIIEILPENILNIYGMYSAILNLKRKNAKNTNQTTLSSQWLASNLTAPSEAINAMVVLGVQAIVETENNNITKELSKQDKREGVAKLLTGVKSNYVVMKEKGIEKSIIDKGSDISVQSTERKTLPFDINLKNNGNKLTASIRYNASTFYSVKNYISSGNPDIKLISHSGEHSFAVDVLKQAFSNQEYAIYNALAFSEGNEIIDENFRILREDLILRYAEQFLSGFGEGNNQSILISNFKAYPVGSIICAMVADMQGQIKNGYIGSGDAFFTISFDKSEIKKANTKIGKKNDLGKAFQRNLKVQDLINKIKFQGKLNGDKLNEFIHTNLDKTDGVSLT